MSKLYSQGDDAPLLPASLSAGGFLREWRILLVSASVISMLVLCASIAQDLRLYTGPHPDLSSKIWLLDVDVEQSAFTWISVVALFFAAELLFRAADDAARRQ